MTFVQKQQFNQMCETLKRIANEYQTPDQLRKSAGKNYGLSYEEALEMAYKNIQQEAKIASNGVRAVK